MLSKKLKLSLLLCAYWSLFPTEKALATPPVLTGRWGDTRFPEQLPYNYTSKKNRALVVVSFSTVCPLARRMVPALNELQRKYDAKGIQFIGLFPNGMDDIREIAEYAVDTDLMFPVFKDDPDHPWHEQLGLVTTPETIVLDTSEGLDPTKVIYRGQVNGTWFGGGVSKKNQDFLADALASFVAGEDPKIAATAASGCKIARKVHHDTERFGKVTYYNEIARMLEANCTSCHRLGEPGTELFASFDDYETVASLSGVMLSRIENRLMPPWHAITDPASDTGGFKHDPRLSEDDINLFRAWVEQDCPAGDPKDAPPKQQWPDPDAWRIGTPDFVFEMPEPYVVPRDQLDEYQYYRIRANFPEERYIQAIEMRPGNSAVVHHMGAILGDSTNGDLAANEAMLKLYGLTGEKIRKIGDYIPGDFYNARVYPAGTALRMPAGQDIFFEMHYTPTGQEEVPDQSKMAIIWAASKPEHILETKVFPRKDLRIKPHAMHYERTSYHMFKTDVLIHALAPHMHFRGKDFTLYKVENPGTPEERRLMVLKVPMYDFNWQRTYEFETPLPLKAGDALLSISHFDNSHYNPNNPDPEAAVKFGLQSQQEMLNVRAKFERVVLPTP